MDQKTFAWKVKSISPEGAFAGMASTYGNIDLSGDVVSPGAFTKSIQSQGQGVTLLWQHRPDQPIGLGKLSDQPNGLAIDGQLLMTDPIARRAYEHLKAGTVKGLSIGYDPLKSTPRQDGGRTLTEVKVYEVSVVTFPSNERAGVTSIKALQEVLPLLASLTSLDLDDDDTVDQLRAIDGVLKRLLPPMPVQINSAPKPMNSERLRVLREIDDALKRLSA